MLAQYVRRLSSGFQASLSYTWSHAIDLDSGDTLLPLPPPSLVLAVIQSRIGGFRSSSRAARDGVVSRARASSAGVAAPDRVGLADRCRRRCMRSGAPLTITSSRALENGGVYALRPDLVENVPFWIAGRHECDGTTSESARRSPLPRNSRQGTLGRNTLRSSPLRQIDLAVSRFVRVGERRLTLRLDAFNVLNIPNPSARLAPISTTPGFGRPFQSYADALGTGTLTGGGLTARPASRRSPFDSGESALRVLSCLAAERRCTSGSARSAPAERLAVAA